MTALAPSSIGHCLELLEQGAAAVTVTPRLARHLTGRYSQYQQDKGAGAWDSPLVRTWDVWLGQVLRESGGEQAPVVLNGVQELALWEQVIRDDLARVKTDDTALWQHGQASRAAHYAHADFHKWCMQDMSRDAIGDDARAFLRWQDDFEQRCRMRGHLDSAMVGTHLLAFLDALRERPPTLPETLIVAGFSAHTPLQEKLFTALAGLGVRIVSLAMPNVGRLVLRCQAGDPEDELHRAASWCRQKMFDDGGTDAGGASPKLGVVISNLEGCRDQAARIFEQVLGGYDPTLNTVDAARLFHLSMGAPLAQYPAVAAALELLEWLSGEVEYETLSRSLRSPHLRGADTEWVMRGRFDLALRQTVSARMTPARLRSALHLSWIKQCLPPDLGEMLHKLLAVSTAADKPQSMAAWSVTFSEWLTIAGWPGERTHDSHEIQTLKAWTEALEQLASLSLLQGSCKADQAWSSLMRIASNRVFNPEAVSAPVQLLGVEEAAGLDFDALWVTGLSDDAWPQPPAPLPFLPAAEQRRLRMPEASWEASLKRARDTIVRLQATAPEVVFSYPRKEKDRELQVSPLIRDVRDVLADELPGTIMRYPNRIGAEHGQLEAVSDGNGPALVAGDTCSRGGTGLFKDQAACPFRAFARHRLGSKAIPPARAALTVMDHGLMVHDVLELLWKDWRTQANLKADTPDQVKARVGTVIDEVLERYQRKNPDVMSPAARALQTHRLRTLLCAHLAFEVARPPFTVFAREEKVEQDFHGVRVRVRIDRIDEIAGGKHVLIDYKTGDAKPSSWFGEHPNEPQLPLYLALFGERVEGVAFARVRRGETAESYLAGLCSEAVADVSGLGLVAKSKAARANDIHDWPGLVERWGMVLKRLAQSIASGEAVVDPQPLACDYCDQHMLCRIDERNALNEDAGEGAADSGAER